MSNFEDEVRVAKAELNRVADWLILNGGVTDAIVIAQAAEELAEEWDKLAHEEKE